MRRPPSVLLLVVLLVAACSGDEQALIETAPVDSGEVVQTVAAPARIEPLARATVTATVAGEVAELLVEDGDEVAAGDPLVRLTSGPLDAQVEQAEAAVEAARSAGEAATAAGVDLSPALGALRGQLDGVFPPLLNALESQATAAESSLEAALVAIAETQAASQEFRDTVMAALADQDLLGAADELDLDALPDGPETSGAVETLEQARRSARDARSQLAATRASVSEASAELAAAEQQVAGQAEAAQAAQAVAVEAQIQQAERALTATQAQLDDLVLTAPIAGVVEFVRESTSATGQLDADLGGLAGLADLEGLDAGTASGLVGQSGGASVTGPVTVGREVRPGQELVRIFDTSRFHAELEVDELDVVEVEAGQPVQLIVDAYPSADITGTVGHVALAPTRGATGGALYPVVVELADVPGDVLLRTGLTASAEIQVRQIEASLVVPTSALLRRGEAEVVYAVRDGVAREVPVDVLAIGDQDAAIDGPVEAGEEVVTIGVELVQDGDEL